MTDQQVVRVSSPLDERGARYNRLRQNLFAILGAAYVVLEDLQWNVLIRLFSGPASSPAKGPQQPKMRPVPRPRGSQIPPKVRNGGRSSP